MVPWFGWLLDVRLHLVVILALIAAALGLGRPVEPTEASWRVDRLALLRQGLIVPPESRPRLPVIAPGAEPGAGPGPAGAPAERR